ncbi:peroxide stress protein YaaA [Saccharopolyspora rhizosphaerae]|uniref:Peroxide stress protein YaaA n=1 Tax=Saccharopolyspora rhizosphaerae TaxID=2492662 RepID=A0A3R8NYT8_9PSEU|nr:peroxide stress protein YaaA [Saccharopolyspora rhizosphaerae]RRO16150.1 peroxide stress protein YaaA [Saccharopolyspora rhizosphaerae]
MLVLLPPSETKAAGGDGAPLGLTRMSHPELNGTRHELVDALSTLATDVPKSLDVLGLSERQVEEVQRNAQLWSAPTRPALERYTGVLYDALDVGSLEPAERKQADARLAVASALFGLVRGTDSIPAYRLSGGGSLPGFGTLRSVWRPVLEPALAEADDLVVDLRSGAYAALAKVPGAVSVRVLSEDASGKRKVVSHHNKSHKGRLARALASAPEEPASVEDVLDVAADAGLDVEREADRALCVVVR